MRPRGRAHVRADAPCFTPGNFNKDATVRPSHGRPRGHRPIVRPSVRKRPRDNPGLAPSWSPPSGPVNPAVGLRQPPPSSPISSSQLTTINSFKYLSPSAFLV
jgi:hypothetical protein